MSSTDRWSSYSFSSSGDAPAGRAVSASTAADSDTAPFGAAAAADLPRPAPLDFSDRDDFDTAECAPAVHGSSAAAAPAKADVAVHFADAASPDSSGPAAVAASPDFAEPAAVAEYPADVANPGCAGCSVCAAVPAASEHCSAVAAAFPDGVECSAHAGPAVAAATAADAGPAVVGQPAAAVDELQTDVVALRSAAAVAAVAAAAAPVAVVAVAGFLEHAQRVVPDRVRDRAVRDH